MVLKHWTLERNVAFGSLGLELIVIQPLHCLNLSVCVDVVTTHLFPIEALPRQSMLIESPSNKQILSFFFWSSE